jgi:hypothetical protein
MTTEQEFRNIANNLVASMVGPNLVESWWASPNRAFDDLTPEQQWVNGSDQVVFYLMSHAFQGGGT